MVGLSQAQLNGILWAVWGQGTRRLVWERPNGDAVEDQKERLWRIKALQPQPYTCPHWEAYRACAEPLITAAAQEQFADQPPESALQLLFQQLQTQPATAMVLVRRVSREADLDRIVEADVWPWLERESAAAQSTWEAAPSPLSPPVQDLPKPPLPYHEQIEPLAIIAYRYHELATQIAYLAEREHSRTRPADENSVDTLTSCATILANHAAYSRSCAASVRNTALLRDQLKQIGSPTPQGSNDADEHQWWTDLTTRPITSQIRATVTAATTGDEIASLLRQLAEEADTLTAEFGDAFERVGWQRGLAAGVSVVGPELRTVAAHYAAGPARP